MSQFFEFVGNHPLLIAAFAATLGILIYTETVRLTSGVKSLTPFAATQLMNEGNTVFLDVRDDAEFKKGHVLDARNIPVGSIEKRIQELNKVKEKEIVVYCDSGMRSQKAISALRKNGFEKLHQLGGGLVAWEKASLPVVTR